MLPFKLSFVTSCAIIHLFFLGAHPHAMKVDLLTQLAERKQWTPLSYQHWHDREKGCVHESCTLQQYRTFACSAAINALGLWRIPWYPWSLLKCNRQANLCLWKVQSMPPPKTIWLTHQKHQIWDNGYLTIIMVVGYNPPLANSKFESYRLFVFSPDEPFWSEKKPGVQVNSWISVVVQSNYANKPMHEPFMILQQVPINTCWHQVTS